VCRVTAVSSEASCSAQAAVSDVASVAQRDVADSRKLFEAKKKRTKKRHKRRRKAGMN